MTCREVVIAFTADSLLSELLACLDILIPNDSKVRLLAEAVRYAKAPGALTTTHFGAQLSLPIADEIAAFLARQG